MRRFIVGLVGLVVAAGLAWGAGATVPARGTPEPAATAATALPPVLAAYTDALNRHDVAAVVALYAPDATAVQAVHGGGAFRGQDEIETLIAGNLRGLPDLTVSTEQVIASGDQIAWAWVYHGAYTGQYPNLPAGHGQPITLRGVSLLTVEHGLITRETLYFDNLTFLAEVDARATPRAN